MKFNINETEGEKSLSILLELTKDKYSIRLKGEGLQNPIIKMLEERGIFRE